MLPRKIPSKITRKMIANFIEARCLGHADFARLVASSPRKNLLNCCRYIDRMARPYAEYDPETGSYYLDVTHRMCYAWAVDYYENPHAIEDWEGGGTSATLAKE